MNSKFPALLAALMAAAETLTGVTEEDVVDDTFDDGLAFAYEAVEEMYATVPVAEELSDEAIAAVAADRKRTLQFIQMLIDEGADEGEEAEDPTIAAIRAALNLPKDVPIFHFQV